MAKSICGVLQHPQFLIQFCEDLEIEVSWGKPDRKLKYKFRGLGLLIDTSVERIFPMDSRVSRFRDVVQHLAFFGKNNAVASWTQVSLEFFVVHIHMRMHPHPLAAQLVLVTCTGQTRVVFSRKTFGKDGQHTLKAEKSQPLLKSIVSFR